MSTATTDTARTRIECPSCRTTREVSAKTVRDVDAGRYTGTCAACMRDGRRPRARGGEPLIRDLPGMNGDWREAAACRGMDTEAFFPVGEAGRPDGQGRAADPGVEAAKDVCFACPVRLDCMEAGMGEQNGIWGGLTPAERRGLRRIEQKVRAA